MQLTVRDAARLLNLSEKTVYRWIKKETIPAWRVGDQYRFNRAELLEWATSRRHPLSPEIFQEAALPGTPLAGVSQALADGGVHYRVGGQSRAVVLRSVVDLLHLPDEVDRTWLYQMLMARELLGTTAIGQGIAIPHVRNPIVMHIPRPQISLCLLDQPVDFAALDGRPVRTLFVLVSPTIRAHLHLLAHLVYILKDPTLQQVLAEAGSREAILEAVHRAEGTIPARSAIPDSPTV